MHETPVWSHTTHRFILNSFGRLIERPYDDAYSAQALATIGTIAHELGAEQVLWQRLSSNRFPEGRWVVHAFEDKVTDRFVTRSDAVCDGILLRKPSDAVVLLTRDCPVLVLAHHRAPGVLVLHCGREALHGADAGDPRESVIMRGLAQWDIPDRKGVYGALTMGIHHSNFPNQHIPDIITAVGTLWGTNVIPDRDAYTLDLAALIRAQLTAFGIPTDAIVHDGIDTFTDTRLGSMRAERGDAHNAAFVVAR